MIWLLRHGDAEEAADDDDSRRLTESGERQANAAGRALAVLGISLDACLASRKVRARDMARIVCSELRVEVEESEALRGGDFDPVDLAAGLDDVLLVGHEPALSRAIQATTGARVKLRKGGLAGIDDGKLIALLGPGELGAIAASR
jgi:phosphohistidine phosphatase SixA